MPTDVISIWRMRSLGSPSPPLCKYENFVGVTILLFGTTWVISGTVKDTLLSWSSFLVEKKQRKIWQAGPSCLLWIVWKARNEIALGMKICPYRILNLLLFIFFSQRPSCR